MPPKLSSGTLNLKFMQRGSPASNTSAPSSAPKDPQQPEWKTVQKGKGKAVPQKGVKKEEAEEKGGLGLPASRKPMSAPGIVYETSLLSYPLLSARNPSSAAPQAGPSSLPVYAGRRSFGNFNKEVERLGQAPVAIIEESQSDSEDEKPAKAFARRVESGRSHASKTQSSQKPKSAKPEPSPELRPPRPKGFMRPAGFEQHPAVPVATSSVGGEKSKGKKKRAREEAAAKMEEVKKAKSLKAAKKQESGSGSGSSSDSEDEDAEVEAMILEARQRRTGKP